MAKKETHQQIYVGSIMLTTDFATDGKLTKAAWERGYVDLGGVLATKSLIAAIGDSFTGTFRRTRTRSRPTTTTGGSSKRRWRSGRPRASSTSCSSSTTERLRRIAARRRLGVCRSFGGI